MKHYQVVEVKWLDASIETDDFDRKEADETEAVVRWTVGYFVADNDDCLVLATDFFEQEKEEFSGKIQIPWDMVVEWYGFPII